MTRTKDATLVHWPSFRGVLCFAALVAFAGCESSDDDETASQGEPSSTSSPGPESTSAGDSTSSTSTSEGTTSSSGASSTGAEETATAGDAPCETYTDADACADKVSEEGLPCGWVTFTPYTRDGDTCTTHEELGLCVTYSGWTTGGGCSPPPGCTEGVPYYRTLESGEVLLIDQCGGSPPVGFQACESGLEDADPPECACLCSLAGA